MARTSTRGWKGCQLCKPHKNRANGDPVRIGANHLRRMGGRLKRVTRKTIPTDE